MTDRSLVGLQRLFGRSTCLGRAKKPPIRSRIVIASLADSSAGFHTLIAVMGIGIGSISLPCPGLLFAVRRLGRVFLPIAQDVHDYAA